ncbi:hypothetical protein JL722_2136 [Aureococcus anophagefferens]|nr:hypothetical protein JL722_2136 [Aureococcus anophagefferens]
MPPIQRAVVGYVTTLGPVGLVSIALAVMPISLENVAKKYERRKLKSSAQLSVLHRNFLLQMINLWFTVIAGSIFDAAKEIMEEPETFLRLLGGSMPQVSVYFVELILIKTLFPYGNVYTTTLMVLVMAFLFAVIAPLIFPFAACFFAAAYLVYSHNAMHVYVPQYETGGIFFFPAMRRFLGALVATQLTLVAYLMLKRAWGAAGLTLLLPLATRYFQTYVFAGFERSRATPRRIQIFNPTSIPGGGLFFRVITAPNTSSYNAVGFIPASDGAGLAYPRATVDHLLDDAGWRRVAGGPMFLGLKNADGSPFLEAAALATCDGAQPWTLGTDGRIAGADGYCLSLSGSPDASRPVGRVACAERGVDLRRRDEAAPRRSAANGTNCVAVEETLANDCGTAVFFPDASSSTKAYAVATFGELRGANLSLVSSDDLASWTYERPLLETRPDSWDDATLSAGPAPQRLSDGSWLLLYNVDQLWPVDDPAPLPWFGRCALGWAILDGDDFAVLARAPEPLVYAALPWELAGFTDRVVYSDGVRPEGGDVFTVYAGAGDAVVEAFRIEVAV